MSLPQLLGRCRASFCYPASAAPRKFKIDRGRLHQSRSMQSAVSVMNEPEIVEGSDSLSREFGPDVFESSTQWGHPGSAQFDFRSDVVTRPTLSMIRAILHTTLQDDVYREDKTTSAFEQRMADLTGHEAGAFVLSGTMANILSLRTHLKQPPHAVLCDSRSHIMTWEAGGIASICGAMTQALKPSNREFLTLEDVQKHAVLSDDVHLCPTEVISLENTVAGLVHPLSELRRISSWSRNNRLKLHLDGARLWEAVATGAGSVKDFAECFDSISIDFSKGLGAPMGAMILGNAEFIARARRIRKAMGGGMRQAGVLAAAANCAVDETFGSGVWGSDTGGRLREAHSKARKVARMWVQRGGRLSTRTETNIVWIDLKHIGISTPDFDRIGEKYGIKTSGKRLVLHYQISEEALDRLAAVFDQVLTRRDR